MLDFNNLETRPQPRSLSFDIGIAITPSKCFAPGYIIAPRICIIIILFGHNIIISPLRLAPGRLLGNLFQCFWGHSPPSFCSHTLLLSLRMHVLPLIRHSTGTSVCNRYFPTIFPLPSFEFLSKRKSVAQVPVLSQPSAEKPYAEDHYAHWVVIGDTLSVPPPAWPLAARRLAEPPYSLFR